ncbi:MAG TPA: hypothetical protein VN445_05110 [Rectinemataceae bacterium]|nr:hypothetical protein [Rectinemataceae bacterium]
MNCSKAHLFVEAWEEGGKTLDDPEEFRAHLESCPDCAECYDSLLPLIERDCGAERSGEVHRAASCLEPAAAGLSDEVLKAIGSPRRHVLVLKPVLAFAAAAIFVVGLGLGIFFTRMDRDTVTVSFVLDAPNASSVYLAGDFNSWSGEGYQLHRTGSGGKWEISVPLKKGKVYVYNFILDGTTWIADPEVPTKIDDGFGGSGSLLRL